MAAKLLAEHKLPRFVDRCTYSTGARRELMCEWLSTIDTLYIATDLLSGRIEEMVVPPLLQGPKLVLQCSRSIPQALTLCQKSFELSTRIDFPLFFVKNFLPDLCRFCPTQKC